MTLTIIPVVIGEFGTVPKDMEKRMKKRTGNEKTNWNYLDFCFVEIGEKAESSPRDLKKLRLLWKMIS